MSIHPQFQTYLSGMVVGMVVVLFVLVPHLEAERSAPHPVPVACAARITSAPGGGSAYAAAKIGYPPQSATRSAEVLQAVRGQICSTCG